MKKFRVISLIYNEKRSKKLNSNRIKASLACQSRSVLNVFEAWWNAWLTSAIPTLMPRPKWLVNDRDVSVGDTVIFNKGSDILGEYKFGMVSSVTVGPDGHIRSAKIQYQNASENSDQITHRAVRSLVIIHRVDEIDLMEELGNAAKYTDNYCYIMGFPWCCPRV